MSTEPELPAALAEIIDESIRLELSVGDLYLLFNSMFPQDAGFWWRLAEEEKDHAALIRSGKEYFAPLQKFPADLLHKNLDELKTSTASIRSFIDKFSRHPPSRTEALTVALTLENSAGEIHFQQFMDGGGGSAIEKIFRELNRGDQDHALRIEEYMRKTGICATAEPRVSER